MRQTPWSILGASRRLLGFWLVPHSVLDTHALWRLLSRFFGMNLTMRAARPADFAVSLYMVADGGGHQVKVLVGREVLGQRRFLPHLVEHKAPTKPCTFVGVSNSV